MVACKSHTQDMCSELVKMAWLRYIRQMDAAIIPDNVKLNSREGRWDMLMLPTPQGTDVETEDCDTSIL